MPTLFNFFLVVVFFFLGWLFDKRKHKAATIFLFVIIGFIPFFSPLASTTADFNPLALPWLIGLLFPKSFQEGHPPAFIFIAPFIWIAIGIILTIIFFYLEKKRKGDDS
ncbi:hypothetical protein HYV50_04905 [Candidatus Pacearchaeota archaeon]|nr:hypothetical protein [Candidatus Pacearchaeota archaeon]